jgi:hypothetical protein
MDGKDQEFNLGMITGKLDLMLEKQDKLENWFVEHAKADGKQFSDIRSDISGMKSKMYIAGALFIAAIEGGKTAVMSWFK